MKNFIKHTLAIVLIGVLAACSSGDDDGQSADGDHGELVPEFTLLSSQADNSPSAFESAKLIVNEWQALGIPVTHEPMETNSLLNKVIDSEPRDYGAFMTGWSGRAERIDPDMYLYGVHHSSAAEVGGNNIPGLVNDEYDEIVENQRREMDPDKRRELVFEAQEILADEVATVTTHMQDIMQAYNKDQIGDVKIMLGDQLFNEWTMIESVPLTDDKEVRMGTLVDLDTLNPLQASTTYEWRNMRLIFDKLVRVGLDGTPQPAAATDWEIVDDTTVDVTIREGMTFHDGEPVTVEDIKFSYDMMIDEEVPYFAAFLGAIDSVEIIDDQHVRFNLNEPYAPLINNTFAQIPILPKHIWEDVEAPREENDESIIMVGSGPYAFEHWRRGEEFKAVRHDGFYEDIQFESYIYVVFSNNDGLLAALEKGEINLTPNLLASHVSIAEDLPHVEIIDAPGIGWNYVGFNMRVAPFDNKAFRHALAHTIDHRTITDVIYEGIGGPGGAGLVIAPASEFWHNPDVERPEFDPEKAREVLEEAGYTWDEQGRLRLPKE